MLLTWKARLIPARALQTATADTVDHVTVHREIARLTWP